jgi:hypothetical protein
LTAPLAGIKSLLQENRSVAMSVMIIALPAAFCHGAVQRQPSHTLSVQGFEAIDLCFRQAAIGTLS